MIALQADGRAMYTPQALWTQAREKLPVTTVLLSNRKYQILIGEYQNVGANPGRTAMDMLDLGNPDIDWVQLANAMGVEAAQASTLEALRRPDGAVLRPAGAVPDRADDLNAQPSARIWQNARMRLGRGGGKVLRIGASPGPNWPG